MNLLVFKLAATPMLVLVATLVGRRYGQATAGWLVGLPLTSGPIAVFVALEHGPAFAQAAAAGSLEGTVGQAFFAATYGRLAATYGWPACLTGAFAAWVATSTIVAKLGLPVPLLAIAAALALAAALPAIGRAGSAARSGPVPQWDLPLRMVVTTALVLAITGAAQWLGPDATGIAATFPLYASVLATFAHGGNDRDGAAARSVVRGLVLGLYGFIGFFVAVSLLVTRIELPAAFALALAANLAIHAASLVVVRRVPAADTRRSS